MKRIVVNWSGGSVQGLAVTVLHFDDNTSGIAAAVLGAFQGIAPILPDSVVVTVPDNGEMIDETNGQLVGVWTEVGTGGTVPGGAVSGASAAGVGGCVTWLTGGIVNGHRVRGRTFIVPLVTSVYEDDGTLTASSYSLMNGFGADLTAAGLEIWSRPSVAVPTGSAWPVTGHRVRDKVAFLSSRRD